MESKLIGLSIFFFIIQSSVALKCFTCNTNTFSKCNDLSDTTLLPQDCSVEGYLSQDGKLLDHLGFGEKVTTANKDTLIPTCLKITSSNLKSGVKNVERLCTFKLQNEDTCAVARAKVQKFNDEPDVCVICNDKDGCNNSNQIKLFSSLIVFGVIVSSARLFV